jgi:hypothetical protein
VCISLFGWHTNSARLAFFLPISSHNTIHSTSRLLFIRPAQDGRQYVLVRWRCDAEGDAGTSPPRGGRELSHSRPPSCPVIPDPEQPPPARINGCRRPASQAASTDDPLPSPSPGLQRQLTYPTVKSTRPSPVLSSAARCVFSDRECVRLRPELRLLTGLGECEREPKAG